MNAQTADPIKAAMIRTLMRQIPSQTGAGIVVAAYMVGTAWAYSATVSVVAWGVEAMAYVAVRFAISRAFLSRERLDTEIDLWGARYTFDAVCRDDVWCRIPAVCPP